MNLPRLVLVFVYIVSMFTGACLGQQSDWTGSSPTSSNWSEASNWDTPPVSGQNAIIAFTGTNRLDPVNDLIGTFQLNRLIFSTNGFSLSGNPLEFLQDSLANNPQIFLSANNASVSNNWLFSDSLSYASAGGATLNYTGTMTGSGAFAVSDNFILGTAGQINSTGTISVAFSSSQVATIDGTVGLGLSGNKFLMQQNTALAGIGIINRDVELRGTTINSAATLTINGGLQIAGPACTLDSGTLSVNGATTFNTGTLSISSGTVFSGSGSILTNSAGTLLVDGTIAASQSLSVDNGLLVGNGTILGPVTLKSGFVSGDLTFGGPVTILADGSPTAIGNTITNVTFDGQVTVEDGATADFSGNYLGTGAIKTDLGGLANFSAATVANEVVIGGTMRAIFTIFNGPITAEGALIENSFDVQNSFNVRTAAVTRLANGVVNVAGLSTVEQAAVLEVQNTSTLNALGKIVVLNGGKLNTNGVVKGEVIVDLGAIQEGNGRVEGSLVNNGTINAGNSAGTLEIGGTVELGSTSTVCIEIGGTMAGLQYDQLKGGAAGTSTASLNGLLDVQLINGFTPGNVDEFFILDNFLINGTFNNTPGGLYSFSSGSFQVQYSASNAPGSVRLFNFQSAIPEPGSVTLLSLLAVVGCCRYRVRRPG